MTRVHLNRRRKGQGMTTRRGRPARVTIGRWRHSEILSRRVAMIVRRRDRSNPETITDVTTLLLALASRVLRPRVLEDEQEERLRDLAVRAKPSEITRTLQSWRFQLPDRKVRTLQQHTNIMEMRWA